MSLDVSSKYLQNNFKADKPDDLSSYEFEDFRLDATHRMLYKNEEVVSLTPKQVETLVALVERCGQIVSKDELMRRLWADATVEESNLSQNLYVLRKTLGRCANGKPLIETFRRRGYRFNGALKNSTEIERLVASGTKTLACTEEKTSVPSENGVETKAVQPIRPHHRLNISQVVSNKKIFAVLLTTIGLAFGVWLGARQLLRNSENHRRSLPTMNLARFTNSGNIVTAAISPDGKYVATVLDINGRQSLWLRQTAAAARGLQLTAPTMVEFWGITFSKDSNFIYYVSWERNQSDAALYRIPAFGGVAEKIPAFSLDTPITFAPDGNRFAYTTAILTATAESYLEVAKADGSEPQTWLKRPKPYFFAVYPGGADWSPDGNHIAYAAGGQADNKELGIFVLDVETQQETALASRGWNHIGRVAWLGDGSGIIFSANERMDEPRQLWFVSYPDGMTRKLTSDLHDYQSVSVTADAKTWAAIQTQENFAILVSAGENLSRPKEIFKEVGAPREKFSWTPDGKIVFASRVGGSWDIFMMDTDGDNKKQLTNDPHDDIFPAVSPDGKHIYFVSNRTGNSNIWRMEIDGSNLTQFTDGANETFPECSPDGNWLVFQRGFGTETPTVWKISTSGGKPQPLQERFAQRPTFSPDGKLLAYVSLEGEIWRVKIVSFASGELIKSFPFPLNIVSRTFRWTRDGQNLAYIRKTDDVLSLWFQPLNGDPPKRQSDFNAQYIAFFDWSPDGTSLALTQSTKTSDVILMRDADQ
ncbi:MAG: winged helix-turn-helix domain-containing protein [Acidobacteriota bacterium]